MQNQTPLEIFRQVASSTSNSAIEAWKESGGKVAGIYYSFIPEELFTAAGILPVWLRAVEADGMEYSDAYLTSLNCSFARYQLHEAVQGKYDFLDIVASANMCDHVRRTFDNWERLVDHTGKKFYFVTVPQKRGEVQTDYLAKQFQKLRKRIEEDFKVQITDEKLKDAIKLHNEIRALQRKLYELRRTPDCPVKGADALAAVIAGVSLPKDLYKDLLEKWIAELEKKEPVSCSKRLMVVGGECDNVKLYELIESMDVSIVTDMQWFGLRSFAQDVPLEGDPVYALADYQLNLRPQDPRTMGLCFERFEQIKETGTAAGVDGYIHLRMPMCDMFSFEQDDFAFWCKEREMPVLKLDVEYIPEGLGQIKTRVQAFLETL